MPQFMWEGIFPILNVLVPGVILALFAAYYQNRRKREIQIEGKLAVDRIDAYEKLLNCLYRGQDLREVTLKEEDAAKSILGYFDVATLHYQCPHAFQDEASFDAFYEELKKLSREYQVYLDDEAFRQLHKSIGIYTRLKYWLDAFCDTEHTVDLKVKDTVARQHIDWVFKLTGMMMFSHCTRSYVIFDKVVCKQMNRFSLTYRKHRIRKWFRRIGDGIMYLFDRGARKKGILGRICNGVISLYIGKEERDMARIMQTVVEVMRYVHFSDRYTPQEYFELKRIPSEEEQHLYGTVFLAMLHRS